MNVYVCIYVCRNVCMIECGVFVFTCLCVCVYVLVYVYGGWEIIRLPIMNETVRGHTWKHEDIS